MKAQRSPVQSLHFGPEAERLMYVLASVIQERTRQVQLKAAGKFKYTCADPGGLTLSQKYTVLGEEFGEVARVLLNMNGLTDDFFSGASDLPADGRQIELREKLRKELTQVAAVACAWLESLEPNERE